MTDDVPAMGSMADIARIRTELTQSQPSRKRRIVERFLLAAIGSIPWIGGFLSAAAAIPGDEKHHRSDSLRTLWLEAHQEKIGLLGDTLSEIETRFEKLGPDVEERIQREQSVPGLAPCVAI